MMKDQERAERKLHESQEWGEHQYVEGYYVGGRIPPWYKGRHRSGLGYLLLLGGVLMLLGPGLGALLGGADASSAVALIVSVTLGILLLASGLSVLRRPK